MEFGVSRKRLMCLFERIRSHGTKVIDSKFSSQKSKEFENYIFFNTSIGQKNSFCGQLIGFGEGGYVTLP